MNTDMQKYHLQAWQATHDKDGRFVGEHVVVGIIACLLAQADNNNNNTDNN